ncbi:MAG: hypothetical protein EBV23_12690, partial [Flavobacteriia bacterium]|nr:hypothetical protein [Flavobacteriia bacterium]
GFEPNWGGFHPIWTRILHGNCTLVARFGTTSFSVGIYLGSRIGGSVGGEMGQPGIFQNRNRWKFFNG